MRNQYLNKEDFIWFICLISTLNFFLLLQTISNLNLNIILLFLLNLNNNFLIIFRRLLRFYSFWARLQGLAIISFGSLLQPIRIIKSIVTGLALLTVTCDKLLLIISLIFFHFLVAAVFAALRITIQRVSWHDDVHLVAVVQAVPLDVEWIHIPLLSATPFFIFFCDFLLIAIIFYWVQCGRLYLGLFGPFIFLINLHKPKTLIVGLLIDIRIVFGNEPIDAVLEDLGHFAALNDVIGCCQHHICSLVGTGNSLIQTLITIPGI